MDSKAPGRQAYRAQDRQYHLPRDRAADAQKNELKPHRSQYWCIPPEHSAEFVAAMEDVLELYQQPLDPARPVICMDETSKQLVAELKLPIALSPGRAQRVDYEYERKGTADVFVFAEPLCGRRWTSVTERRTRIDWAHQIRSLVDIHYPDAQIIRLVMDNLNIHSIASLYEAFPPAEARRLSEKLEIHYTPKHGSWLNIAAIELKALSTQCMNRRIESIAVLRREVKAWETERNHRSVGVDWQFTTD